MKKVLVATDNHLVSFFGLYYEVSACKVVEVLTLIGKRNIA